MASGKTILGYWAIKGRAESIRLLLAITGISYENKIYSDRESW